MRDRIKRLEDFNDGERAIAAWLSTSRAFPDRLAYLTSTANLHPGRVGIHGIMADLESVVRGRRLHPDERKRLTRAKADAVFLYYLAEALDAQAAQFAALGVLRLGILSLSRDIYPAPDGGARGDPFTVPFVDPGPSDPAAWLVSLRTMLTDVAIEERMRLDLEARYFNGRSVLFDDTARDWARLRWLASSLEEEVGILSSSQRSTRSKARVSIDAEMVERHAHARAVDVRDLARVDGLRYLGAHALAQVIVDRHVAALAG
jgi:hypothetical protein